MPQLTDRSKLPNIVDPVIKNTMDLKHLYQVCLLHNTAFNAPSGILISICNRIHLVDLNCNLTSTNQSN